MSGTAAAGGVHFAPGETIPPPLPPFSPVQVTDSLPPVPETKVLEHQAPAKTLSPDELALMKRQIEEQFPELVSAWRMEGAANGAALASAPGLNRTGLTMREIRLLSTAVDSHNTWRGTLVGHSPEADEALAEYDAGTKQMREAIKKLRKASGMKFSGKRTKR
jgi:hypothetical protein